MESPEEVIRRQSMALLAAAQSGLTYGLDEFDRARYRQVQHAATALLSLVSERPLPELRRDVDADTGYATPKVDVRGAIFDDKGRVLLTQERSDGLWSLPGGWCDVGEPPSVAVCREVSEESGLSVRATRLAAVLDRELHGHWPPMAVHVYKLFFLCELDGRPAQAAQELETLDVGWFPLDGLPPLSISRVTEAQLSLLRDAHDTPTKPTLFD